MQDLENNNWIFSDPLGNIYEKYGNMSVMTYFSLNNFWIAQVKLCLKGTFVKAGFMFVTIFAIFMKIPGEKTLLTLPVPSILT